MTSAKEYRDLALECGKQAAETKDERLRSILMETARLWMEAALRVETAWALKDEEQPPAPRMKRA